MKMLSKIILPIVISFAIIGCNNHTVLKKEKVEEEKNQIVQNAENEEAKSKVENIKIEVNGKTLDVKLEDNSSAEALIEKLKQGSISINAQDYGSFEKVGSLGFSLPSNDERITTECGDLILYQGNQITLYYDTNTWTFTKLGKVQNVSKEELKEILGDGDVTLTLFI